VFFETPAGAVGVTRFTSFAGVTSTGAGGAGCGAAAGGICGVAEPADGGAATDEVGVRIEGDCDGDGVRVEESPASSVRPENESVRLIVVVPGELRGAFSGIDSRGASPIGAPYVRGVPAAT